MPPLEWYDYFRVATIILSVISMYMLITRALKYWDEYTARLKQLLIVLVAFIMLQIEGSFETILTDAPGGPRTVLSLLVSMGCLFAVANNREMLAYERKV